MKRLRNIFYRAGFHVVSLGSPFTRRFAVSASTSSIPGIAMDDARDIYVPCNRSRALSRSGKSR